MQSGALPFGWFTARTERGVQLECRICNFRGLAMLAHEHFLVTTWACHTALQKFCSRHALCADKYVAIRAWSTVWRAVKCRTKAIACRATESMTIPC